MTCCSFLSEARLDLSACLLLNQCSYLSRYLSSSFFPLWRLSKSCPKIHALWLCACLPMNCSEKADLKKSYSSFFKCNWMSSLRFHHRKLFLPSEFDWIKNTDVYIIQIMICLLSKYMVYFQKNFMLLLKIHRSSNGSFYSPFAFSEVFIITRTLKK